MTIMDAIYRIDELKPNSYSQSEKIKWLSTLDGLVKSEIIDTHEGGENIAFTPYNENSDLSILLLIPAPYDDIYIRYLEMQINYANGEFGKYNNSMDMYDKAYEAFAKFYNRTHMPIGNKFKFF